MTEFNLLSIYRHNHYLSEIIDQYLDDNDKMNLGLSNSIFYNYYKSNNTLPLECSFKCNMCSIPINDFQNGRIGFFRSGHDHEKIYDFEDCKRSDISQLCNYIYFLNSSKDCINFSDSEQDDSDDSDNTNEKNYDTCDDDYDDYNDNYAREVDELQKIQKKSMKEEYERYGSGLVGFVALCQSCRDQYGITPCPIYSKICKNNRCEFHDKCGYLGYFCNKHKFELSKKNHSLNCSHYHHLIEYQFFKNLLRKNDLDSLNNIAPERCLYYRCLAERVHLVSPNCYRIDFPNCDQNSLAWNIFRIYCYYELDPVCNLFLCGAKNLAINQFPKNLAYGIIQDCIINKTIIEKIIKNYKFRIKI